MEESVMHFLERTTPLGALARLHRERQLRKRFRRWQREGAVGPMPNLGKQQVVRSYAKRFSLPVFVETGTYKGKMVYALMPYVSEIYSIELDSTHYENARKRFAGYANIHLFQGQSGEVLPKVLSGIRQPCLFWLDAHWSGGSTARADLETPIMQELACILDHPLSAQHVVLVDDARCFTGQNDYPSLGTVERRVRAAHPDWVFEVREDIIRTHAERPA